MGYELICARTRGASHVKANTPCEDYGIVGQSDFAQVFVVSDGHGDKSCPRSDVGSKLACEIARRELLSFSEQLEEMDAAEREVNQAFTSHLLEDGPGVQEATVRHLVVSIIGQWADATADNLDSTPLTEEERAGCSDHYLELYDKGERLEHIFGATLIAGLMTERYLLLIQQGDGRCDVFYDDATVEQPIPWDSRCTANVTTSLCDEDAIPSTRYCVIDLSRKAVIAVLAGSDGVEDAYFSMDGTHNFYRDLLLHAAKTSVPELQEWLEEFLPEFSRVGTNGYGSQDDVTVCGFIDVDKVRPLADALRVETESVTLRTNLKTVQDRLSSMETGKLEYLQRRLANAVQEEKEARKAYESARKQLEILKEQYAFTQDLASDEKVTMIKGERQYDLAGKPIKDVVLGLVHSTARNIRAIEAKLPELEKKYKEAHDKVEPARKELFEYTERKRTLTELLDRYQRELDELMGVVRSDDAAEPTGFNDLDEPEQEVSSQPETPTTSAPTTSAPKKKATRRVVSHEERRDLDDTMEMPVIRVESSPIKRRFRRRK